MSKNTANLAQSVWRSPKKRSIDSQCQLILTQVVKNLRKILCRLFSRKRKQQQQKKTILPHRKEKVTKTSNRGKARKTDRDHRNIEVEPMICEWNKRCMVSENL